MERAGYTETLENAVAEDPQALVTAEELAANHPPYSCELAAGRVVPVSPAGVPHGLVVGRLMAHLCAFVSEHDLGLVTSGETGFWVQRNPDTVRAPDLAYVSHDSIAGWKAARSTYFPTAPDLAVEVLSPDDRWVDVEQKVHEYLGGSGRAVWVLNPRSQTVHVFDATRRGVVLQGDDLLTGGDVLPRFEVGVSALFDVAT